MINHLHRLGLCISYDEVVRYKGSAIEHGENTPVEKSEAFVQWVAANVDHNIVTLTGQGTFHGMGMISIKSSVNATAPSVPRIKQRRKTSDFIENKDIKVKQFLGSSQKGLSNLKFDQILNLTCKHVSTRVSEINHDLVWHAGWFSRSLSTHRPNWNGFMQKPTNKNSNSKVNKASISFLPIIDLNPSDENCIFSTLSFIIEQAKQMNIEVPCVTFDQPLWLKAIGIIEDARLPIVCRLGGFHTLMSFLRSIGNMIKGSWRELFAEVYAENSVVHMLSGKAISRALRAHFLAESSLTTMLINILIEEGYDDINLFQSGTRR